MNQHTNLEPQWEREPFTPGDFITIVAIPIGFVLIAGAILFTFVIQAGG